MATQKATKKEKIQKEKKGIKWIQDIRSAIKNETALFVAGLLCVSAAISPVIP